MTILERIVGIAYIVVAIIVVAAGIYMIFFVDRAEAAGPNPCAVYNNWTRTCYPASAWVYRTRTDGSHIYRLVTICRCAPR